jgi:hypothetical protein
MRKPLLTAATTLAWLLASPTLQLPEAHWLEVGAPPAAAQEFRGIMIEEQPAEATKPAGKKAAGKKAPGKKAAGTRGKRVGSGGLVTSNQPGLHPMQPVAPPRPQDVTGTVVIPERDPRYPDVPVMPIIPRGATGGAGIETSQDRVSRCTHQGVAGGLAPGQQGVYVHHCAF